MWSQFKMFDTATVANTKMEKINYFTYIYLKFDVVAVETDPQHIGEEPLGIKHWIPIQLKPVQRKMAATVNWLWKVNKQKKWMQFSHFLLQLFCSRTLMCLSLIHNIYS